MHAQRLTNPNELTLVVNQAGLHPGRRSISYFLTCSFASSSAMCTRCLYGEY